MALMDTGVDMDLHGLDAGGPAGAPLLQRVEHTLGVLRTYLVECATQEELDEERCAQFAQLVRASVRQLRNQRAREARPGDAHLPRHVVRQVVRFVNENLDSKLKWDDIAREVGMEPYTFGRRFKLSTGLTVHQYVIRSRLRHAMSLLLNSKSPLSEIALDVGFSCQSHMTTAFSKHLGTTPAAFRTQAPRLTRRLAARAATSRNEVRPAGALASSASI